jgi:hypothetical protein
MANAADRKALIALLAAVKQPEASNKPSMLDRATVASHVWLETDHAAIARVVAKEAELNLLAYYVQQ